MKKLIFSLFLSFLSLSLSIPEIQGIEHRSKYEGQKVENVVGVVTAKLNTRYNKGVFIQSLTPDKDPRTSEALFVKGNSDAKIGDVIKVSGTVREIQFSRPNTSELTITSIELDNYDVVDTNKSVKPVLVDGSKISRRVSDYNSKNLDIEKNAADYFESLENMLIEIKDPYIVGSKEGHGEIAVVPSNGKYVENKTNNGGVLYSYDNNQTQKILVGDEIISLRNRGKYKDPNFTPNPGDKFSDNIEGVLVYSYGNYKIYNTKELPKILNLGAKPDKLKFNYREDMLNVVSYNIENFSRLQNGRVDELAKQVVYKFKSPDIIGFIEMEDDDSYKESSITSAAKNLKAIVKKIREVGGPQYSFIDIAPVNKKDGGKPGSNIRNVIIYREDRLKLAESKYGIGNAVNDTDLSDDNDFKLVYNPGRIANNNDAFYATRKPLLAHFKFKDKDIIVMVNHLSSKRSDLPIYGVEKPVRKSEINRIKQAKYINDFVKKVLNRNENITFVIMGDMNDFEFSPTIKTLEGQELFSVINSLPLNERHTYVHQGNSQVLDHILLNNKYKGYVNIDVLNINSEFTESQGSFSDHDPLFIQFKVK